MAAKHPGFKIPLENSKHEVHMNNEDRILERPNESRSSSNKGLQEMNDKKFQSMDQIPREDGIILTSFDNSTKSLKRMRMTTHFSLPGASILEAKYFTAARNQSKQSLKKISKLINRNKKPDWLRFTRSGAQLNYDENQLDN
jgi:hypothetical protein